MNERCSRWCSFSAPTVITVGRGFTCPSSLEVILDPKKQEPDQRKNDHTRKTYLTQRHQITKWRLARGKRHILHFQVGFHNIHGNKELICLGKKKKSSTFCFLIQLLLCQVGWVCTLKYFSTNAKFTSAVGSWFAAKKNKAWGLVAHKNPDGTQQGAIYFHLEGLHQSEERLAAAAERHARSLAHTHCTLLFG